MFEIDCVVRVKEDEKRKFEEIYKQKKISEDEIKRRVDSFLNSSGRIKHFRTNDNLIKHGMCLLLLKKESKADTHVTEVNLGQARIYLPNIAKGLNHSKDLAKRMRGKTFDQLKKLDSELGFGD